MSFGLLPTPSDFPLGPAASWSADNAHMLQDVHWIGGSPLKDDVYGYAGMSKGPGTHRLELKQKAKGFQNGPPSQSQFEMCFAFGSQHPTFQVLGAKHASHQGSVIKKFKPHFVYDLLG